MLPILEREYGVGTFVLERRDVSQDLKDIRFVDALRSRKYISAIRVELWRGETDARLWLPNQLLGAYDDMQAGSHDYESFLGSVRTILIQRE